MEYRNAVYTFDGRINCEINHPIYGWIPFTADPQDVEEHCRDFFHSIKSSGNVAEYTKPEPIPEPEKPLPTHAELAAAIRERRNRLLAASDWTQIPDVPEPIQAAWKPYRQALRDITQQPTFPQSVTWPEAP